jgi:hypothetical protein
MLALELNIYSLILSKMVLTFSLNYDIFYFLKRFKDLENKIARIKEREKREKEKEKGNGFGRRNNNQA